MGFDALTQNAQDLQQDVIDLLGQIISLMARASTALRGVRQSRFNCPNPAVLIQLP